MSRQKKQGTTHESWIVNELHANEYEARRIADIQRRKALRPGWLDEALRTAGVIGPGETL